MSKFGALIDLQIPVLIDFYTEWNEQSTTMHAILRDVAAALGDRVKVVKIDVDKNQVLRTRQSGWASALVSIAKFSES